MEFSIATKTVPFVNDSEGIIRIGDTRVTLNTVITAFKNGSTCEEIVYQYPVLKLADVYSAISYYLNDQDRVESYLEKHDRLAESIKENIQSHFDTKMIRERLLKRKNAKE
ncbi:DUF433 domain-containing protein [candidate division KSB1 bacterium]|nr:DUF433 domain-containing protein [candidate division KSB1 bacterium]MBL7092434.1 DUF433 domain-containing protein [candidate division KSB1 bacterium]